MRRLFLSLIACLLIFPSMLVSAASPVKTEMNYCIIRPYEDGVEVVSMVSFRNTGKETLQADASGHVLTLQLPKGAEHIQLFDEKDTSVKIDQETIYTTKPIKAGQIIDLPYSYRLAGQSNGTLTLPFNYPSDEIHVLIPKSRGDLTIEDAGSAEKSSYSFNSQEYIGYTLTGKQAGQPITVNYTRAANQESGENQQITTPTEQSAWLRLYEQTPLRTIPPRIFVAVMASVAVMLILFAFSKWQKKRSVGVASETDFFELELANKQSIIMEKIIELEKSYQQNKLTEEEFTQKQEAYKELLVQIQLRLREQADLQSTGKKTV